MMSTFSWSIRRTDSLIATSGLLWESAVTGAILYLPPMPPFSLTRSIAICAPIAPYAEARATAPDPSSGGGQYLIVVGGSIRHDEKDHQAFTVVFLEPSDKPFDLRAGAAGANVIVMNFPQPSMQPASGAESGSASRKKWRRC